MIWGLILALVVAAAVLLPFLAEARRPLPDQGAAPGEMIDLPGGTTHVRWLGPVRGPVAVAVHGLTTPSEVWEEVAEGLGLTGYRVLTFDLYGRGFSDSPTGPQTLDSHVAQLEEVLSALGLHEDLTIIGYSMGGAIATAYAARHPESLTRLMLVAPACIEEDEPRIDRLVRDGGLFGDWLALTGLRQSLLAGARQAGPDAEALIRREIGRRGYIPSVVSSARHTLRQRLKAAHQAIAAAGVPVMAVWGREDQVVPIRAMGMLKQWNRSAKLEVVDGAGHDLMRTHTDEVIRYMRQMLRGD